MPCSTMISRQTRRVGKLATEASPQQHMWLARTHLTRVEVDWDDAPFWEVYPKLKAALSHIARSAIFYERAPEGGPRWGETSNPDEDPPDWHDESRSYCLFFVSSMDDRLTFATDTIEPNEEGVERRFQGEGRIGYGSPAR